MGKEWIRLKETGQLFLERVLVSFDIPIFFVCVDYENRKYLCLNIDEESGKSVIVATDNEHLIAMLKNEITMDYVFRESIDQKVIIAEYDFEKEEIISYTEDSKTISADMLPKENVYFEFINKEIEEYISYLEKQRIRIQNVTFSSKKSFIIQRSVVTSNYVEVEMVEYTCKSVTAAETNSNCSYNINKENRMIA